MGDGRATGADGDHAGFGEGRGSWAPCSVVQVLSRDGRVVGAGFLAGEDVVVTCAHVVRAAGGGPGDRVELRFPNLPQAPVVTGRVLAGPWRAPEAEDVAAVRLEWVPAGARQAPLGSAAGCRGHQVSSFGFPAQAPERGHFGYATAGDLLPAEGGAGTLLQLSQANDLTTGFSGGPVVDEVTSLVIGMVTAITAPDAHRRGLGIAYATPAEALREVVPGLAEEQVSPYRGLEPFTALDADWFHGRETAVDSVLAALRRHRLVLLLGPSGGGKSSLVQAGVVPALADGRLPGSDRWLPLVARPGQDLPAELERAGLPGASAAGIGPAMERRLATDSDCDRLVVVIDQFEELLTQPPAPDGLPDPRLAAAAELAAVTDTHVPVSVVLIMRDDFYPGLAARFPQLLAAATPGVVNVPATLGVAELHAIITRPARTAGARLEDGLPERIIEDLRAADPDRHTPVTLLPPLQLALRQLWERRVDGRLTHQAYHHIGEVTGSLATWCNNALGRLPADHRPTAHRILTALVRPADDAHAIPAARQQVPLARLRALASSDSAADAVFDDVMAALTRDRIITTGTVPRPDGQRGDPAAELIHDALIRDWGELRERIARDHRFQVWLRRVTERHDRHTASGLSEDLLAGSDLAEGLDWARQRPLPADITAFLTTSREHQQATIRRTRRLNVVLAGMLTLALIAAGLAYWQRQTAVHAQHQAQSRLLASRSQDVLNTDPDLAALLAVQAYRTSDTDEAAASLFDATAAGLKDRLTGHTGKVLDVAYAPDGRTLATASDDGTVRLWDATTGTQRDTLIDDSDGAVNPVVAFAPDGHTLATADQHGVVRLWDATTGTQRDTLTRDAGVVTEIAFAPNGRTLATGSAAAIPEEVRLWDVATGSERDSLTSRNGITAMAYTPDGQTLATADDDGTVRLWDTATGARRDTLTGHDSGVSAVAYSPDGQTLATAGNNGTVRLWDVATGSERGAVPGHESAVTAMAYSPDGQTLARADEYGTVRLWDVSAGAERDTFAGHADAVQAVAFAPDGKTLTTAGGEVRLWDVATGSERHILTGHNSGVYSVAFAPNGWALASVGEDGMVRLWDTATGVERESFISHDWVNAVAFTPDGKTLASADEDGTVRLWDTATGRQRDTLTGHNEYWVNAVAFTPDGKTLASVGGDGAVRLWDTATGRQRDTLTDEGVRAVAFSPNGQLLATASADGVVRLWDAATVRQRDTLKGHSGYVDSVAFAPDGRTLATADADGTVRLWDSDTGRQRGTLNGHDGGVTSMAFAPDGRILATAGTDETIRLWDVATGTPRATLIGHYERVNAIAFAPDGKTLATTSDDETVRLWNVALPDADDAVRQICQALDRDFTRAERSQYLQGMPTDPVCPTGPSR